MDNHETVTMVVAVNDRDVLRRNLRRSPELAGSVGQIVLQEHYASAATAYNAALDEAEYDVVVFVHQDVYLPKAWFTNLARSLRHLDDRGIDWGVLGCFGVSASAPEGIGRIYSTGWGRIGRPIAAPEPVDTLDEIVLVIRKSSGLRFDAKLPHFHLYGTDLCLSARARGMTNFAFPGYCVHNTNQLLHLPSDFHVCYRHIKRKWRRYLPIQTSCIRISRLDQELWLRRLEEAARWVRRRRKVPMPRCGDPTPFADESPGLPAGNEAGRPCLESEALLNDPEVRRR